MMLLCREDHNTAPVEVLNGSVGIQTWPLPCGSLAVQGPGVDFSDAIHSSMEVSRTVKGHGTTILENAAMKQRSRAH